MFSRLSRKEREKEIHRQEILAAARELFVVKGYHETTLEEIARQAEFGKGTIYNYFTCKEELFQAIIKQLISEWESLARTAIEENDGDCRQRLYTYARQVILLAHHNATLIGMIMHRAHQLETQARVKQMGQFGNLMHTVWKIIAHPLQMEQKNKKVRPIDAMALATLFDGMLRSYCINRFGPQHVFESQEIDKAAEMIVTIFFDGISLPG